MKNVMLAVALMVGTLGAQAQQGASKPNAAYVKHLHRYQQLQAQFQDAQARLNRKLEKRQIEARGLESLLASQIPQGYQLDPALELFVPVLKPEPKPEVKPESNQHGTDGAGNGSVAK